MVRDKLFFSHIFESWSEVHAHCLQFEILPFHISNLVIASHLAQLVFQHQTWLVQFYHWQKWNASSTYHLWGNSAKDLWRKKEEKNGKTTIFGPLRFQPKRYTRIVYPL